MWRSVGIDPESLVLEVTESGYIETNERIKELAKMMATKPDMIQGYYFGKPSPAERFEEEFLQPTGSL